MKQSLLVACTFLSNGEPTPAMNLSRMLKRLMMLLVLTPLNSTFAGPILRVALEVDGKGSGLIVQAYQRALRSTPGVVLVPKDQPWDTLVQIECAELLLENGGVRTGYAWAEVLVGPRYMEINGPRIISSGKTYQSIMEAVTTDVSDIDTNAFSFLRKNLPASPTQ